MPGSFWEFFSDGIRHKAGAWKDEPSDELHPYVQPTLEGVLVSDENPLPVKQVAGIWDYASGVDPVSVNIPEGARIRRVDLQAGSAGSATVAILGKSAITVVASSAWGDEIIGDAIAGAETNEVVFAGAVESYYVSWVV